MRKIYKRISIIVLILCFSSVILFTACSEKGSGSSSISEEVYQLGNQEIQIELSDNFKCTKENDDQIILEGESGRIQIKDMDGNGISSDFFPKSEQECAALFQDVIGTVSYQIEDFHSYEEEGLYYATIRYDLEKEIKYLIVSGKFSADAGCQISAILDTGNRETAQKIQSAVYNVKVFIE